MSARTMLHRADPDLKDKAVAEGSLVAVLCGRRIRPLVDPMPPLPTCGRCLAIQERGQLMPFQWTGHNGIWTMASSGTVCKVRWTGLGFAA